MRDSCLAAILLAVGIAVGVLIAAPAYSLALYGTNSNCDCLYKIDLTTGDTVFVGYLGAPGQFETPTSMAVDLDGTIYTVNNETGELLTLDRKTGAATVVATGVGQQDGLAIAPVDVPGPLGTTLPGGTLFGSTFDLVIIDKATGALTPVGPIGRRIGGLAFRSDGTLFGAELSLGTDTLVTLSTETGVETKIGEIGPSFDRIGALVFTADDELLGSDINTLAERIIEIDQTSGAIIGQIPVESAPQGMGFAPAVECTTFDDLDSTIANAEMDNHGIRNSFQVKANNARKKYDQGKPKTSGNVLCALLHHLDAQEGKHVTLPSAEEIRDCVITLAANLEIPLHCLSDSTESLSTLPRNYPNPFRFSTLIEYTVDWDDAASPLLSSGAASKVVLKVFDMTGREIRTLVDSEQEAGYYIAEWDGRTDSGREASNGIYFYDLRIDNTSRTRKMVLLR
jgi:hypothetical protein